MDMNSQNAMAEKLSVPQLKEAVKNGTLHSFIAIPLIEEKTKLQAQMAAAKQGQQKPPSIVAQVLQQADQQEQQERGIDELPSNLPMMEDEEMGMAGGGIVAFAERGQVRDPYAEDFAPSGTDYSYNRDLAQLNKQEIDSAVRDDLEGINLSNDPDSYLSEYVSSLAKRNQRAEVPSYLRNVSDRVRKEEAAAKAEAVAKEGREKRAERERVGLPMADRLNVPGINPFTPRERVDQGVRDEVPNPPDAFRNDPGYDPVPASPAGRFLKDTMVGAKGELTEYATRDKLIAPYLKAASGLGNATDTEKNAARTMIRRIAQMSVPELNALAKQDSPTAVAAIEGTSIPARMQPTAAPQAAPQARQADADLDNRMLVDSNAGITAAPGAKSVNPVVPGAPRTAPTGVPSAGPRTAPQGGALPPTLAAAERSDSPAANQATSMLDKYVAMLEKSGEDVGRQKKEALYMALIQGGLGMMGGTSPNAFANIAAGLLPATQAYQQAMRDIKKDDRARIEKLINAGLSKEKFAMELRKLGIEDKKADAMINYYNARAGAAGAGGSGDKEDRLVRQGYERSGIEYDRAAQLAKRNMANALKDDSTYTGAKTQLTFAKNLKPEDRTKLEKIIRDREAPYLDDITYNRNMAKGFFKKAGVDLSSGGGGKEDVDLNQFFK
jgi:hypothetical protein